MQNDKIYQAMDIATEFLKKANKYIDETSKIYTSNGHEFNLSAPKQSGALRRASMELTRALAEMRKP